MTNDEPPTETFEYVTPKRIGTCDKCKQGIYELATFKGKRFSMLKGIEWLHNYVEEKLLASGVIPEDALFELTRRIVQRAFHAGTSKLPDRYIRDGKGGWKLVRGKFACIDQADREIEWAIKYPPPPISHTRFSLKAFVKERQL